MRGLITFAAVAALVATTLGAAHIASQDSRVVCLPPAVVQALS
jgi:hypothetical protein